MSPAQVLSEYIWTDALGWRGGPSCTVCITADTFSVQPNSKVLYAMGNNAVGNTASLRVGFVSAGAPTTLSEVDFTPAGGWKLVQLPN